tara:strand:+ start:2539 stop:2823 length:285 start_codon:yes stop_codon:yes gene_type:complete
VALPSQAQRGSLGLSATAGRDGRVVALLAMTRLCYPVALTSDFDLSSRAQRGDLGLFATAGRDGHIAALFAMTWHFSFLSGNKKPSLLARFFVE